MTISTSTPARRAPTGGGGDQPRVESAHRLGAGRAGRAASGWDGAARSSRRPVGDGDRAGPSAQPAGPLERALRAMKRAALAFLALFCDLLRRRARARRASAQLQLSHHRKRLRLCRLRYRAKQIGPLSSSGRTAICRPAPIRTHRDRDAQPRLRRLLRRAGRLVRRVDEGSSAERGRLRGSDRHDSIGLHARRGADRIGLFFAVRLRRQLDGDAHLRHQQLGRARRGRRLRQPEFSPRHRD